ncbi:hypothetical protein GCM10009665_37360 [Kitasatospora nipponensis]|uniref:Polymerase nucleotidyl transferase domain-containing protein n=1 Tax=Kitasatospora nipponensis TaxID=258049 RepID=A0ABN1WDQ2_9ACTN
MESRLELAALLAEDLFRSPEVDSVYLGGSLTAGLGNATSDIDIFVLLSGERPPADVAQLLEQGERLDVEYHTLAEARARVERVLAARAGVGDLSGYWTGESDLDFTVRLLNCRPVSRSPAFDALFRQVTDAAAHIRRLLLGVYSVYAQAVLEDLRGAWDDGDQEATAHLGQSALLYAAKGAAAAAGQCYLGTKWVFRQLRQGYGDQSPHRDLRFGAPDGTPLGEADVSALTGRVQELLTQSQLIGWHGPADRWHRPTAGTGTLVRNPDFMPFRIPEGVLLSHERVRQLVVKPQVAAVWWLSHGLAPAEVAATLPALAARLPEVAGMGPERVGSVVAALVRQGLLLESGEPGADA